VGDITVSHVVSKQSHDVALLKVVGGIPHCVIPNLRCLNILGPDDNALRSSFHPHFIPFQDLHQAFVYGQKIRVFKRGYVTGLTVGYLDSIATTVVLPNGQKLQNAVCVEWLDSQQMFTRRGFWIIVLH